MKKIFFFCLCIVLLPVAVFAQDAPQDAPEEKQPTYEEYSPDAVPEGMEVVAVTGGYKLIVPKGSKLRKVGAQIIVEGQREYMSRHFEEMGKRFEILEKEIEGLKLQIKQLQGDKKTLPSTLQEDKTILSSP